MPLASKSNIPLQNSSLTIVRPATDYKLTDAAVRQQLLYEIGVQKAKLAARAARNLQVLYGLK